MVATSNSSFVPSGSPLGGAGGGGSSQAVSDVARFQRQRQRIRPLGPLVSVPVIEFPSASILPS